MSLKTVKPPLNMILYILTNNLNLVDIISSGMIKPAVFYQKYYSDLGIDCSFGIPLLASPPSADLVEKSIAPTEIIAPVLLEISVDGLSGPSWIINAEYKIRKGRISQKENVTAQVVNGILPSSLITQIHFRSEKDLSEFLARKYANMEPEQSGIGFKCTPEVFIQGEQNVELLLDAIKSSGTKIKLSLDQRDAVHMVDSIAGAVFLLGKYASIETGFPLDIYRDIVNSFIGLEGTEVSVILKSSAYSWLSILLEFLNPSGEDGNINEMDGGALNQEVTSHNLIENSFCRSAIRESIYLKPGEFSPDSYLEAVLNRFEMDNGNSVGEGHEVAMNKFRDGTRLLLDVRSGLVSMDEFSSKYPAEKYPTFSALFLFFGENRPHELFKTLMLYPDFPIGIRSLSVFLSGALHGRTRLGLDIRPGKRLSYILDIASISWINKKLDSIMLPVFTQAASVKTETSVQGVEEILSISGEILIRRMVGNKVDSEKESSSRPVQSELLPVLKESNIQTKTEVHMDIDKAIENLRKLEALIPATPSCRLAVDICRKLHWEDLISTCIQLKDHEYVLENRLSKHEIRVAGYIVPEYRINKFEEFKNRLASLTSNQKNQIANLSYSEKT